MTNSPSPSVDEVAERRAALLTIIRDAVVNVAQRHALRRGPYILDEAELQGLASEIAATAASLVSPPKAGVMYVEPTWPPMPGAYANHEARGDGVRVTDEMVDAALRAAVPGGAEVSAWLPTGTDKADRTARAIMRAALEAALPPLGDGRAEIVEACAAFIDKWLAEAWVEFGPSWFCKDATELPGAALRLSLEQGEKP